MTAVVVVIYVLAGMFFLTAVMGVMARAFDYVDGYIETSQGYLRDAVLVAGCVAIGGGLLIAANAFHSGMWILLPWGTPFWS